MATIKLIGELDIELTRLGLKPGDIIKNATYSVGNRSMNFDIFQVITNHCSVYPDNYEVIEMEQAKKTCVKATFENDDTITTWINLTPKLAREYYLNMKFNLGVTDDNMQKCIEVKVIDWEI